MQHRRTGTLPHAPTQQHTAQSSRRPRHASMSHEAGPSSSVPPPEMHDPDVPGTSYHQPYFPSPDDDWSGQRGPNYFTDLLDSTPAIQPDMHTGYGSPIPFGMQFTPPAPTRNAEEEGNEEAENAEEEEGDDEGGIDARRYRRGRRVRRPTQCGTEFIYRRGGRHNH